MREIFEGVSFTAFAAGNRRIIKAVKARSTTTEPEPCGHPEHQKPAHTEHCASHPEPVPTAPAEHPFLTWAKRIGGTIGVLVLLWPMVGKWVPTLAGSSAALWVIVALIAGQDSPGAEPATDGDGQADEASEDDDDQVEEEPEGEPAQPPEATAPMPADARRAVAVLGADGTHVSLTAVTAHLAAAHPLWKQSGKAVRALLQEARVEVRGGVRVEGVSVPGIHHDDVPPLPSPSRGAPEGVVVPGQSNNNNNNGNNTEWTTREGFVMRAHPDEPARTIVLGRPDMATP